MKFRKIMIPMTACCLLLGSVATVFTKNPVRAAQASYRNTETKAASEERISNMSILVQGYEWGPGVPKVILELTKPAQEICAENITVTTAGTPRVVEDIYLCDKDGIQTASPSPYAALELKTTAQESGSPFTYNMSVRMNEWAKNYEVSVSSSTFTIDGSTNSLSVSQDCIDSRICPDTENFQTRKTFTGFYENPFTQAEEELTLRTAAYEPEDISGGEKNPLIIWLHGQGEGGRDVDIALLGNEVCALARDEIQSYFTAGSETGSYVLAVQCETYWMDEGDGRNGRGFGSSRYTEILMDTIADYVRSNPDIDIDRIYLGGCSNGGYMTVHMLAAYPDYFAAGYPVCEAYAFDEDFEKTASVLKDIPLWFTLSADDAVVNPQTYTLPSYRALLHAGAKNAWLSLFQSVNGSDSPGSRYYGHFSWIYVLNNQVTGVQDRERIKASTDNETFGAVPTNNGGGALVAGEYRNLFAWLNAQSK